MDAKAYRVFLVNRGLRSPQIAKRMRMSTESLNRKVRLNVLKAEEIDRMALATEMSEQEFLDIFYPKANLPS